MKLSSSQTYSILIFIAGVFIIGIIYINLNNDLKNIVNFFTLFGTFVSVYGIILAYLQLRNLNEINSETKAAVENSILKINQILSVSELSRAIKIIQEIQTSIQHKKNELCLLRLKDLKTILIQIKFNKDLEEYTNTEIYNNNITDLSIDINNISDLLIKNKLGVDFSKINSNLESLSTTLSEFENKLKFK